jgi:hypothetical protein
MIGYPSDTRYGERNALSAKRNPEIIATKRAYGKNPVHLRSRITIRSDFLSSSSI